jgi:hypothetical protein
MIVTSVPDKGAELGFSLAGFVSHTIVTKVFSNAMLSRFKAVFGDKEVRYHVG